jgi:dipeptidyl aminopeptidase/acylaminoacyl peptidase
MRDSRIAVCASLAGLGLGACSGDGDDVQSSDGCDRDAPAIVFDHETTDPDRGIGGGVPEVSVVSAGGDVEMITGSWVASQAAFSPDGEHVVVVKAEGDYESAGPQSTALWILGADGSGARELTGGRVDDEDPDWSTDGSSIVFVRDYSDGLVHTSSITTVPSEGGEPADLLSVTDSSLHEPVWSPDGQRIAFVRSVYHVGTGMATTVWTMAADGSGARPLAQLPYIESLDWYPDGTSLLVDAGMRGQAIGSPLEEETYRVDARTGHAESIGTGAELATWAPDGNSIYYFRPAGGPESRAWSIVEGRVEESALVDGRTVLASDDLADTVLADVGLYPGFSLAIAPCG